MGAVGHRSIEPTCPTFTVIVCPSFESPLPAALDVEGGRFDHLVSMGSPDGGMGQNPDAEIDLPLLVEGVSFREVIERGMDQLVGQFL
jgi:hypothetical protein